MQSQVTADLNTLPLSHLVVLLVGIIIIMVVAGFLIKKLGLSISKGTIKTSDYEYDQNCESLMYRLQEDIEQIDYETRSNLRKQTKTINYKISKMSSVDKMCNSSRRSLFYAFKEPFFECINNNHFTRELMPENYESYRAQIIENFKSIHQDMMYEYNLDSCKMNELADWDELEASLEDLVDSWLTIAMVEVKRACYRKIKMYKSTMKDVEKSKRWSHVLTECIEKNEKYISNINDRLTKLKEQRG